MYGTPITLDRSRLNHRTASCAERIIAATVRTPDTIAIRIVDYRKVRITFPDSWALDAALPTITAECAPEGFDVGFDTFGAILTLFN